MNDKYLRRRIATILRTQSCTSLLSRCSLQHLPVELIVDILDSLPAKHIVMWQSVSRQFRDIIASSVTLQYKIECCVTDVLREPFCRKRNKAEQINAMREWSTAWKKVEWKMELTEASALAQGVSLDQPPAVIRKVVRRTYNFDDLRQYIGYGYDEEAGVLVVAELNASSRIIQLTPLDIITRKPHSEWCSDADPMALEIAHDEPIPSKVNVSVCGDAVMFSAVYEDHPLGVGTVTEYCWFAWPEGYARMHFWSDSMDDTRLDDFCFLSDCYILATVYNDGVAMLASFDTEEDIPGFHSVEEIMIHATMLLDLPCMPPRFLPPHISIDFQPERHSLPTTYRDALFTPANSSAIIQIHIPLTPARGGSTSYFDLLAPLQVIMHHVNNGCRGSVLGNSLEIISTPSSEWCDHTRIFKTCSTRKNAVCNSRYVTTEADPESGRSVVAVYDFRPLQSTLYDLGRDITVDIVLESKWDTRRVYANYERTSAPYRRVRTKIILEDGEHPEITEDSIVVVNSTGLDSRRARVYCF